MTLEQLIGQFKAYTEYPNQDTFVISRQTCKDILKYLTEQKPCNDADDLEKIQSKYNKINGETSYTPEEVCYILVKEGQENSEKYRFKLGDTIKFSPGEVERILKANICTYRETGCGSCAHPQSCPYKIESEVEE